VCVSVCEIGHVVYSNNLDLIRSCCVAEPVWWVVCGPLAECDPDVVCLLCELAEVVLSSVEFGFIAERPSAWCLSKIIAATD